jgi:hypothetical protein
MKWSTQNDRWLGIVSEDICYSLRFSGRFLLHFYKNLLSNSNPEHFIADNIDHGGGED